MIVVGIDPGIHGGIVILEITDRAAPVLVDAVDIPVTGVKAKERVDVLALRAWILAHQPQHAFIERAQAMPKQGASSGFKYGRAVGAIEGVIACCEIPMTIVEPAAEEISPAARGRQGRWTPARAPVVSRGPRLARSQERSRAG